MNHIDRCYEVLGLKPGASIEKVKQAKRDLAKVWHPDRFPHDPRLQQMAQEKLKEINEAYEQLHSFYRSHRRRALNQYLTRRRERYGETSDSLSQVDKPPETDESADTRWVAVIMVVLLVRALSSQVMAPTKDTAASLEETPSVALSEGSAASSLGEGDHSQTVGKVPIKERSSFEDPKDRNRVYTERGKPGTSWKPVVPSGHFGIGSTQDDVLAIQGEPSIRIGNTWHYKDFSITFSGGRLSGYSHISKNLKVRILPGSDTSEAKSRGYFTIGSTKDEVVEIQGTPSSVTGNTWHYGDSLVDFYRDRVSDYSNSSKNLKARLKHPIEPEGQGRGSDETQLGKAEGDLK
ncbi:MAG: J domain-containing protein [Candidatus Binatia bacterium]